MNLKFQLWALCAVVVLCVLAPAPARAQEPASEEGVEVQENILRIPKPDLVDLDHIRFGDRQ